MHLVERHVINKNHKYYEEIERLCFRSKNLYNAANYVVRQEFIHNSKYLNYQAVQKQIQSQIDYKVLPAKVSQQVLILLDQNWKSYFEAKLAYSQNPSKFLGHPKLPKYKDKVQGRNIVVYTIQAISKPALIKRQVVKLSQTRLEISSRVDYASLCQVRLVPKLNHYVVEVVYNSEPIDSNLDRSRIAGIDLGLGNLATITSNVKRFQPLVINGRPLKSINQFFNKKKALLQSIIKQGTTKKIQTLCTKRNLKVDDYLHKASRAVIDLLIANNIGTLALGKNDNWKQALNIGKRNNQNFTSVPHDRFIDMLSYKAQMVGIIVTINEESYTSKSSFLDLDPIPTYKPGVSHTFSGKRIRRGMYRSRSGHLINADCNGSYNIIRKAIPNAFSNGIEGVVVHPVRLNLQIN